MLPEPAVISTIRRYIDHPRFPPGSRQAYLAGAIIVVLATAMRLAVAPWIIGAPYISFFPAVISTSFLAGSAAGIAATLLSVAAAWLFIIPAQPSPLATYQSILFVIGAATVTGVIGAMRAAADNVRRSNERLRLSEARFRGLLEAAPDAMVIVDEHRRIALINARTEQLFGHRRMALLGAPLEMLVPKRERDACRRLLDAFIANAPSDPGRVIERNALRKDGSEFPAEVSLGPLTTDAGTLVSIVIRDVTARRQIEARLVEASRAKSEFLAGMSHELRTPLNAIIGFSEMIRDAVLGPLDARYRSYGGDINTSGRHLHKIINDILDIAKVESGRLELRCETVSVGETIEACRRIVAVMAEAAGVALEIDVPAALPPIQSDQVRFQQILLNLMSNAVKFTPSGGRVRVTAGLAGSGLVIAVADTGIGMKAEDIPRALEPFRQIDGILSRRFAGTGLGLPLAKALVELHGGRLEIESAFGEGTTVRVSLPLQRVDTAAA